MIRLYSLEVILVKEWESYISIGHASEKKLLQMMHVLNGNSNIRGVRILEHVVSDGDVIHETMNTFNLAR